MADGIVAHINSCYPWFCGDTRGYSTTNEKHVSCSKCLGNKSAMDKKEENLIKAILAFADEFKLSTKFSDRIYKCHEEDLELDVALIEGSKQDLLDELADRVITGVLAISAISSNPEAEIFSKLTASWEKYHLMRE